MGDVTVAASIFYNPFVYLQIFAKLKIIQKIPAVHYVTYYLGNVDTLGASVVEQVIDQSEDWWFDPLLLQFECQHIPLARYEPRVASDAFIEECMVDRKHQGIKKCLYDCV